MRSALLSWLIGLLSLGACQAQYKTASNCLYNCRRRLEEEAAKAQAQELEEFEEVMKQGLRGLKVMGGCGHTCDCFTCGDVVETNGNYEITINHCKEKSISWICCTGSNSIDGSCTPFKGNTACGSNKCESVSNGQMKVVVPNTATSFTINTHDGQTAGNADMNNEKCGGNGNQGGKCANKVDGATAHCDITFNIANECNLEQPPPLVCDDEDCIYNQNGICEDNMCKPRECFCFNSDTYEPYNAYIYNIFANAPAPGLLFGDYPTEEECLCLGCDKCGPGVKGDPHVSNWKGEWFDYMGECDIKFFYAPLFDGKNDMEIAVRTTIRDWYSFVEAAAMKIGDEIVELDSYGNFVLNDVEGATTEDQTEALTLSGYPVYFTQPNKKHTRLDVVLNEFQNVTFKTFKTWVSVAVTPGNRGIDFSHSTGLMGNYQGQMLARNGTDLHHDMNALAQDWQYRDYEGSLFRSLREPQWPQKCNLPAASLETTL